MRVKKYKNRKMYCDKSYINNSDIIAAIKAGENVEVFSHDTGLDVTNDVLKEALYLMKVDTDKLIDIIYNSPVDAEKINDLVYGNSTILKLE